MSTIKLLIFLFFIFNFNCFAQTISESELIIEKPSSEVPINCAVFSGKWTGKWSNYNLGQRWLWVTSVDKTCLAKFYFSDDQKNVREMKQVVISDNSIEWTCGRNNGKCVIKNKDDEMTMNYSGFDGSNFMYLKKE